MKALGNILLFVVVVSIVAGSAPAQKGFAPTKYRCSAVLDVRPRAVSAFDRDRRVVTNEEMGRLAARYVLLIKSEGVIQQALASDAVRATSWFTDKPEDADERLAAGLTVSGDYPSGLIWISMTGPEKKELPDLVNAVARAAVDQSTEIANREIQNRIRAIRQERSSLDEQRDRLRADMNKLLRNAPVPDLTEQSNVMTQGLHRLSRQASALEMELVGAEAELELIRRRIQTGDSFSTSRAMEFIERDPVVCALLMRQAEIRAGLVHPSNTEVLPDSTKPRLAKPKPGTKPAEAGTKPADASRPLDADRASAAIDREIAARKDYLKEILVKTMLAEAETRKATVLAGLTKAREKYRFADVSVRDMRASLSAYRKLEAKDKILTSQIDRIDDCLLDLRIILQGSSPLEILTPAFTPGKPSSPK